MHVGMATIFQNPHQQLSDYQVYRKELHLADQAEPLGYQSIWGVEHHFTDYTLCPDVLQFLSYMAGRTERAKLGSAVVVLPWHDPLRVAEEVSMLDQLSGGRAILGIGRGLARVEYQGFRLDMAESRARFLESAECLLSGLKKGYCEYQGQFINQPRRDIRPQPSKTFRGRTYAAAISPESSRIMAELGVGMLVIPQKPWEEVSQDLQGYRQVYLKVNQEEAPPPIAVAWTFCHEDGERAYQMARRYIGGYWQTVMDHYEFKADHLKDIPGYEYYGKITEKLVKYGDDRVVDFFVNLQVWGTPEQCYQKALDIHRWTGNDHYVGVFSYAAMPYEEAEGSMKLFAREVLPALQRFEPRPVEVG
ncbi:MAG: LLM class flavin-dependent oxidoreductase [SAR202 cluster bacterium]|nr:LLM class flavin-dependent oxidoreductase [SAR202 cluster bacterium]